jgi:hypothetical protein
MLTAHVSSVIAISCARIYLVVEGQWETDESWYYDPFLAVENAEIGATLFALSVPALKPLFGNLFIKIDSTISSNFGRSSRSRAMSTHQGDKRLIPMDQYERAESEVSSMGVIAQHKGASEAV